MLIGFCVGYALGLATMVLLLLVGERFRAMEAADKKENEQIEAKYIKWCEDLGEITRKPIPKPVKIFPKKIFSNEEERGKEIVE